MINRLKSKLSKDANLKELLTGSAITFVLKITGMALGYVVIYMISRKNGAEGVGYYSLINQLLLLLGVVATLGMNVSVLRYVGQYNNPTDAPQMWNLYARILSMVIPVSIVLGLLVFLSSEQIAYFIFKNIDYAQAIEITGIALPFFALNRVGVEFIRGLKKLKISEFIRSVLRPIIVAVCLLIYWTEKIPNVYIIYFFVLGVVINSLLSNGAIWIHLLKIESPKKRLLSSSELLKVSSPMMVTAISSTLMATVSLFLIEYFSTTDKVGIYSVAFRISQLIAIVLVVVNTIAAPKFSELFWAKKTDELQKVIRQSAKMMFWAALFLSIAVIVSSKWVLAIFGDDFASGQLTLIVLVIGQLVNAATGSVGLFLNMSGNQKILRNTALISLAIQCIIAVILIPLMGILGAAIASTVAGSLWNLMCVLYVSKRLNLKTYYIPLIN